MKKSLQVVLVALLFSITISALGYISIGLLPSLIWLIGFLGGFIVWLIMPARASWASIKVPYFVTLVLLLIHRFIDEQFFGFFEELEKITGVPFPTAADEPLLYGMTSVLFLVWLFSPILVKYGHPLGYYGAWSFFFVAGVAELAHFIFPLFTPEPYGYFPGMLTVVFLAPVAWWGMWRLYRKKPLLIGINKASSII